ERCVTVRAGGVMRAARWQCAFLFAIAACQVNATSAVQVDASSAVQVDPISAVESSLKSGAGGDCRPILTKRCVASNCGHSCTDDARAQLPPGHLFHTFECPVHT